MQRGILTLAIIVALASLLIGIKVNVQEATMPRLQQQIDQVLSVQNKILGKLVLLEKSQKDIKSIKDRLDKVRSLAGRRTPPPKRRPQEDFNKVYNIPIGKSFVRGKKDAPVTIVEFSDFQCPFSQRFHPVIDEVLKAYPNKVKYMLKYFPLRFHPMGMPAAKATLAAAEQGKYWEMVELIFKNGRNLSQDKFVELAKQLGLNIAKFKKDLKGKDAEYERRINKDIQLGRSVNVRGTPTFYINGKKTRARTLGAYKQEIDAILKAKKTTKK